MKLLRNLNFTILGIGIVLVFLGSHIFFRGTLWNFGLGDAKVYVGSFTILVGLLFLALSFFSSSTKSK